MEGWWRGTSELASAVGGSGKIWALGDVMSQTSRSQIPVAGSTPSKAMIALRRVTRRGNSSSASFRFLRHAAVVGNLRRVHAKVLVDAGAGESSLPAVSVHALALALSGFLQEIRVAEPRGLLQEGTSSTPQGHFMDSRDRGRKTRAEREAEAQERVRENKRKRDLVRMQKHHS